MPKLRDLLCCRRFLLDTLRQWQTLPVQHSSNLYCMVRYMLQLSHLLLPIDRQYTGHP